VTELTLFSWGYWGWGNATRHLVEAVDAVERRRGFQPPIFVDTRISRSVRAAGFRDSAFEQMLGPERYRWMRRLGNKAILTRSGPAIQIMDPAAAEDLLDLALEAARAGPRLVFFCSCEWPALNGKTNCHRVAVGDLVLEAARRRRRRVEIVEWPGGDPEAVAMRIPTDRLRRLVAGAKSLPLPREPTLARFASLPWGSVLTARSDLAVRRAVIGPAKCSSSGWNLPVLEVARSGASMEEVVQTASAFRRLHGLEKRLTGPIPGPAPEDSELSDRCVYTIAHRDKLEAALGKAQSATLRESRRWTTAAEIVRSETEAGRAVPILFADAADCSVILYVGLLREVSIDASGTAYTFERLARLRGRHRPQDLRLLESGRNIAPGFIRPYALCRAPAFLRDQWMRRATGGVVGAGALGPPRW
jgi:hypothetical protein